MPLSFLLDENQRGDLWVVVQRHNARGLHRIDVTRVGDEPALPLGTEDAAILSWCEREDRVLVTYDKETMPGHLALHIDGGQHCPGIFILRDKASYNDVLEFMIVAAYASNSDEWRDSIFYIP